jgi:hypothetical protein
MRFIPGFLSAVLGMLAGWSALAALVVMLAGPDRDGGIAMGAVFDIGPIGGVAGLIAGIWLFMRFGLVRAAAPTPAEEASAAAPTPAEKASGAAPRPSRRPSFPFAVAVTLIATTLAWWAWYELIRSPDLTHGFMTLELQFRLPAGMALPDNREDVRLEVEEANGYAIASPLPGWRAHQGDRAVILGSASLMYKTRHRVVRLTLPGVETQSWRIDLGSDPDPSTSFSPWRVADQTPQKQIEMNFRLSADR